MLFRIIGLIFFLQENMSKMPKKNIINKFPEVKLLKKPRKLRQTWLKDVGFHEAPHYLERMGLSELEDFLEVAADRIDYVKFTTPQVLYSPKEWLDKKIKLYKKYEIVPYLDHTYFKFAYKNNCVEHSIKHGKSIGFDSMEFMNTGGEVSEKQWIDWRKLAKSVSIGFMYEHHPLRNWKPGSPDFPSSSEEILKTADPFLNDGADFVILDHEEFELQNENAKNVFDKVINNFGLEKLCFEVTSPREGLKQWHKDLSEYIKLFGQDCNVCNIMPSQILQVEPLRDDNLLRQF